MTSQQASRRPRPGLIRRGIAWYVDYVEVWWWQSLALVRRRIPRRYREGGGAPVVLLPGVYETWHFLRALADRLNAQGHPIHVIATLGYNRASIPEAAARVARYVVENDLRGVVLLAHSKGGLIGKHVMELDDPQARVAHLVAINSPFAGSRYARYIPLRTVRAFVPTEPTLAMLAGRLGSNARITSIFAEFDPHIPGGSALDGATNVRLPVLGHFRPLRKRVVIEAVVAAVVAAVAAHVRAPEPEPESETESGPAGIDNAPRGS